MARTNDLSNPGNGRATGPNAQGPAKAAPRLRRRLVLLCAGEDSDVQHVLHEYSGEDGDGTRLHEDIQRRAADHPGRVVAGEWLGPLGWTRFLWCRK